MHKIVVDALTGKVYEKELTAAELEQRKIDEALWEAQQAEYAKVKYLADRKQEYPCCDDIVEALYQHALGNSEKLKELQAIREKIDAKYPPPV